MKSYLDVHSKLDRETQRWWKPVPFQALGVLCLFVVCKLVNTCYDGKPAHSEGLKSKGWTTVSGMKKLFLVLFILFLCEYSINAYTLKQYALYSGINVFETAQKRHDYISTANNAQYNVTMLFPGVVSGGALVSDESMQLFNLEAHAAGKLYVLNVFINFLGHSEQN
jgi:hypothetical protein